MFTFGLTNLFMFIKAENVAVVKRNLKIVVADRTKGLTMAQYVVVFNGK